MRVNANMDDAFAAMPFTEGYVRCTCGMASSGRSQNVPIIPKYFLIPRLIECAIDEFHKMTFRQFALFGHQTKEGIPNIVRSAVADPGIDSRTQAVLCNIPIIDMMAADFLGEALAFKRARHVIAPALHLVSP